MTRIAVKKQTKFQRPPRWATIARTGSLLGKLYIFYFHSKAFISLRSHDSNTPQLCIRLFASPVGNILLLGQYSMLKHLFPVSPQ